MVGILGGVGYGSNVHLIGRRNAVAVEDLGADVVEKESFPVPRFDVHGNVLHYRVQLVGPGLANKFGGQRTIQDQHAQLTA